MKKFKKFTRNKFLLMYDVLAIALIFIFTKILVNHKINSIADIFESGLSFYTVDLLYFLCCIAVYFASMFLFKCHQVIWSHAGTKNYIQLLKAILTSTIITTAIRLFFKDERFAIVFNLLFFIWVLCSRMALRGIAKMMKLKRQRNNSEVTKNILIIGAGDGGTLLLHDLSINSTSSIHYNVVGFIDSNPNKKNSFIEDIKVLGDLDVIESACKDYSVDEIHLAIPSLSPKQRAEILNACNKTGCKLKIMVSPENALIDGDKNKFVSRDVEIEDLLDRESITLDNSSIEGDIKDKVVMVTGGGGSIGSELCRQIVNFSPKRLIVFDIYENNAYDLQMQLKEKYPNLNLSVIIGSVRDQVRLDNVLSEYKPHIIFHAAAHKHVPLMEDSPGEAIKNNVFGTYNIARLADKHKVSKFVMISTDKAVNPTNIMGATKRMCEMVVQAMDKISETKFVAVRFGNVLGSNGSVIPLFKRQIAHGGPVTVTHKDITRFFMTIPEASQLVIQAAANAGGGEIFVLDMGSPVRIYDLAENLIRLSGYTPNVDIPIKITGLRPGEKLYEELLMSEEGLTDTSHKKIFIGKPSSITLEEVDNKLEILKKAVEDGRYETIKNAVKEVVPTYNPADN